MDPERLERLLDQLATPLSHYTTARATIARLQLGDGKRAPLQRLTGALKQTEGEMRTIHDLIMAYAGEYAGYDPAGGMELAKQP